MPRSCTWLFLVECTNLQNIIGPTLMPMKVMYCNYDHYTIRRPIINQDWQLIPTTSVYEALSCKTRGTFANKPEHAETVLLNSSVVCYACKCSCRSRVTTRIQCSCGITRYYVIATNHVCAKSAELVHIEVKKLTERVYCAQ